MVRPSRAFAESPRDASPGGGLHDWLVARHGFSRKPAAWCGFAFLGGDAVWQGSDRKTLSGYGTQQLAERTSGPGESTSWELDTLVASDYAGGYEFRAVPVSRTWQLSSLWIYFVGTHVDLRAAEPTNDGTYLRVASKSGVRVFYAYSHGSGCFFVFGWSWTWGDVQSAFEMLGIRAPGNVAKPVDQGERFIQAITGEKRNIPTWSGQPASLRSWLKLLAVWESETTLPKDKWGLKLFQSFAENSQPRKIADQIPMHELLSEHGYGLILTQLLAKYKPFLDIAAPAAIDRFLYSGDRQKNESFAAFLAAKEVARQDMELHLQERISEKDQSQLLTFDQVAALLRPLDRPELLAQAAGAELGAGAKHFPVITDGNLEDDDEADELLLQEEEEEESDSIQDDELLFEDREYNEDEALFISAYHSAYADIRKDLKDRKKERGFVRHRSNTPFRGRGRGRRTDRGPPRDPRRHDRTPRRSSHNKVDPKMVKGSSADLQARVRCFNCNELGHYAKECPLKGALVDTAAEDAVIGSLASKSLQRELALWGLQPLPVCAILDIPTCVAGHRAINILDFDQTAWELPPSFRGPDGALGCVFSFDVGFSGAVIIIYSGSAVIYIGFDCVCFDGGALGCVFSFDVGFSGAVIIIYSGSAVIYIGFDYTIVFGIYSGSGVIYVGFDYTIDFSYEAMEDVVSHLPRRKVNYRTGTMAEKSAKSASWAFGLYVRGPFSGVTKVSHQLEKTTEYGNAWLRDKFPQATWTSWNVNLNMVARPHIDSQNAKATLNHTVSMGSFQQGELWLEADDPPEGDVRWKWKKGKRVCGTLVNTFRSPTSFSPHRYHGTAAWSGYRISITAFTTRNVNNINQECQRPVQVNAGGEVFKRMIRKLRVEQMAAEEAAGVEPLRPRAMGTAKCESAWRRLVKALMLMLVTARQQMVLDYLNKRSLENEPEVSRVDPNDAKKKDSKKGKTFDKSVYIYQAIGRPLPTSHAHKEFPCSKRECQHPADALRCRANVQSHWWTCVRCGLRWDRPKETEENTLPELSVKPAYDTINGHPKKLINSKGQEFPQVLPPPKGEGESLSPPGDLNYSGIDHGMSDTNAVTHFDDAAWEKGDKANGSWLSFFEHGEERVVSDACIDWHGAEPGSYEKQSGADGGISNLRGQPDRATGVHPLGRRVVGYGDGQPQRCGGEASVMIYGKDLENAKGDLWGGLRDHLGHGGWLWKTALLLLTMTQFSSEQAWPSITGPPQHRVSWNPKDRVWSDIDLYDNAVASPGRWCYVFTRHDRYGGWLADDLGVFEPLKKDQRNYLSKNIAENLGSVAEIYSPPRMIKRARQHGFQPGFALDLVTGWDFNVQQHQREALRMLAEHKPSLIVLSPPCTVFSKLRALTNHKREASKVQQELREGHRHVKFAVQLAFIQHDACRGFVFEHPMHASSWKLPELQQLASKPGVHKVQLDMCRFDLRRSTTGEPVLKPTALLTNVPALAKSLARRCEGRHVRHPPLLNGTAREAAVYTVPFVDAILRGMRKHLTQVHFPVFHKEDAWCWRHGDLCCRHFRPRQTLATPSECSFDLSGLSFTGKRCTVLMFVTGREQYLEDDFNSSPTSWKDETPWTGFTYFQVVQSVMLPQALQDWASHVAKASSHCLHSYVQDEAAFQSEWNFLFPTRKMLGSRRSSTSAGEVQDETTRAFDLDAAETVHEFGSESANPTRTERMAAQRGEDEDDEAKVMRELRDIPIDPEVADVDGYGYREGAPHLAPDLRRELYRVHRNLGHPDQPTFLRALRHAGAKPEVLEFAKRGFKCPICERRQRPSTQRPAHLQHRMPFNEVVGVDLIFVRRRPLLNCLCWGTSLQWVETLSNKTAGEVCRAFMASWVARYGAPRLVVADRGTEFTGSPFPEVLGENGIILHLISARAPWENARTERAGGWFKNKLETVVDETSAINEGDFQIAIAETVAAHNQHYDRSGFSPNQRVYGTSLRLPSSLASDDYIDAELRGQPPRTDFMKRAMEIREAAQRAWLRHQDNQAIRKALNSNTRTSDDKKFESGDMVYVFRDTSEYKGWVGPGVVIAQAKNERSLWISLRGFLVKAAKEQVRKATAEESLGVELVKVLSQEMLENVESGKIRNYQDLQHEFDAEAMEKFVNENQSAGLARESRPLGQSVPEQSLMSSEPPTTRENDLDDEVMMVPDVEMPSANEGQPDGEATDGNSTRLPSAAPETTSMPSLPPSAPMSTTVTPRQTSPIRVDEGSGGWTPFGPARSNPERAAPYPWPASGRQSNFLEVTHDGQDENLGAKWWRNKAYNRWEPVSCGKETFQATQATAFFNLRDKRFYLTKQKLSPGQVEFRNLDEGEKAVFRKARAKEVQSLIDMGAIRILSLEESRCFEQENPRHVLNSKYVDRYKPKEEFKVIPEDFDANRDVATVTAEYAPKSRWTVVGWQDPHIHEIERSAPTPLTTSLYLFFQLSASRRWHAFARDAKTAFLQSRPTSRKRKLACRMPSDEAFEGYDARQLILLETEVYGLVSGPAWWRRSLLEILVKELGYRVNVYDRCVLTLDNDVDNSNEHPERTQGVIIIEVDDLMESGGERHRQKMVQLEQRLKFGKAVKLADHPEGAAYAGRRITQDAKTFSFRYTMTDYIQNRLKKVVFERKVYKKDANTVTLNASEESQLRGVLAAINWVAREGRPDVSAAASMLAGRFPGPTADVAFEANSVVDHLKAHHVAVHIHSIPEPNIRHILISDSSGDSKGQTKPQHGWIQGVTTPQLNRGEEAPVSIIGWCSRRLRRKAGSSLLCESIATSTAMAALEKQVAMWQSMTTSRFDPRSLDVDIEVSMGLRGSATVIASEGRLFADPLSVVLVDAKSLFDSASSEQAKGEDDRSALEAPLPPDLQGCLNQLTLHWTGSSLH
ncbi:unnamed protein product [Symbiodinium necroappetens]|uniref:Uncharacterized protein n=1 Tax=Symbiodinium necroappetens TaxID=1628268 RepID=A0A812VN49_9DINO|nr:unnamed protein product [Symbiodinium necroappetens]